MKKWMRNYRAEFVIGHWDKNGKMTDEEVLTIAYPFTCNFMTDLGTYASANRAVFQFYNLSRTDQAKLWKDVFEAKKYIKMSFFAGYGNTLPLVFRGMVNQCLSSRPSGSVDWITEMQVFNQSSFKKYGYVNATFTQGTEFKDIIAAALARNPDIKLGYLSPDIPPLPRNTTFIGQTLDILGRNYGEYEVFVNENLELNIIGENDVLPGQIQVITDSTGLLGSPRRANAYVELDTLFEPQIRIGQAVSLLSESMPQFNRAYKVCDVRHQGIISPTVCGELATTMALSMFGSKPRTLQKAAPTTYTGTQTTGKWLKPVKGMISSPFGMRNQPIPGKSSSDHQGIDIACINASDVVAPANGRVSFTGARGGYGYCVILDHGLIDDKLITSLYAHLSQILVNTGQVLAANDLIGKSGGVPGQPGAGSSTGAHLHFEIRQNGIPVNPIQYVGSY